MTATVDSAPSKRLPIWPVLITPIVVACYYLALKFAFARSITAIVNDASDVNLSDFEAPQWGSHWFYRGFAEFISISFGTFIAAGIARNREKLAGIIGGLAISLFYAISNSIALYVILVMSVDGATLKEPWSQHIVEGLVIVAAPFIGAGVSDTAQEMNSDYPNFHGINRWHFVWLWIPAFFYALGLLGPIINFWLENLFNGNRSPLGEIFRTIVYAMPVVCLLIPLLYGLALLSGRIKSAWPPFARNTLGSIIIILGVPAGMAVVYFWAKLIDAISG